MSQHPIEYNHRYSVYFAPRGNVRMYQLGMQLAQRYLTPFDKLIGIVGEAGSGKSMLVKGMFPGLELSNDDEGVNVRPLPILHQDDTGFFSPHTYHLDIRFESAFTQMHELAEAINEALSKGKRVIVEHFELIYPLLGRNAELLIGVGEEILITRPTFFGPEPGDLAKIVFKSIRYRKAAHSAEDLLEHIILQNGEYDFTHSDVQHGFLLGFPEKPELDVPKLQQQLHQAIEDDIPISYYDETHILIGDTVHFCTGPRMHVASAGEIGEVHLFREELIWDEHNRQWLIVGVLGNEHRNSGNDLNRIAF